MKKNSTNYIKHLLFLTVLLCTQYSFAQTYTIKGRVSDIKSGLPIGGVNIKYQNSLYGTATDNNGEYIIRIPEQSDSLIFSSVNHINQTFYITNDSTNISLNVIMTPEITQINEVVLSGSIEKIIKEKQFRVRDYEVFDDNLIVIGYKNRFSTKSLLLLNFYGDTLDSKDLLGKADSLYRDFNNNYYLISGDSVFYIKENNKILFRDYTNLSLKTFQNSVMKCLALFNNQYFFSRHILRGQQLELYYFNQKSTEKTDFITIADSAGLDFVADLPNYRKYWARMVANTPGIPRFRRNFENVVRFDMMVSYPPIYSPIITLDDKMLVFDHENGYILYFNSDLKLEKQVPINYQVHENWGQKIYFDKIERKLYTSFVKNGFTTFKEINLETGGFERTIDISNYDYIEKPIFSNGTLFFMYDEDVDPVKNLYRMRL